MPKIIQWNIHGYWNNYTELQIVIKFYYLQNIALQETYITNTTSLPCLNYTFFTNININNSFGANSNKRGRILATFIDRSNNIQLNEKSPTHFSATGNFLETMLTIYWPTAIPALT